MLARPGNDLEDRHPFRHPAELAQLPRRGQVPPLVRSRHASDHAGSDRHVIRLPRRLNSHHGASLANRRNPPKRKMTSASLGRTFHASNGKVYRPSLFVTLTLFRQPAGAASSSMSPAQK